MIRELASEEAFEFYRNFLEFYCSWLRPDSYLEIGLAEGSTFQRLIPHCGRMRGVDPVLPPLRDLPPQCELFSMTSDEFFHRHPGETYDLVFIDGLHQHQQVLRDVRHALGCLAPKGVIMAHDMFPPSPELTDAAGCGDAYKAAIDLRQDRSLEVFTIPVTYGLTLIGKIGSEFPWV
jgi:hypothetical protein